MSRRGAHDGPAPARSFAREVPVLLFVAVTLAFLLRTFVVQVFYIPSESMVPTLEVDDRIAVEKITGLWREPQRGEVIVFAGEERGPGPAGVAAVMQGVGRFLGIIPADAQDFVKRVVGLPGETVVIEDGFVFVDGIRLDEPYVINGDGRSFDEIVVPDGSLYVLGDNRPNSGDSRLGLGFVDLDNVVGRAVVVLWPPSHAGGLNGYAVPDGPVTVDSAG